MGDGVSRVTWGNCVYDGTKTTCTLSGPFTGLGPGGTWVYTLTYPGNGPSPLDAITAPGSDLFTISLTAGGLSFVFNESNGTSVTYDHSGSLFYVQGLFSCTGTLSSCDPGTVGQTPGATETGPVSGTLNVTPAIQAAISASDYGGFSSIAPATWIEIYGQNLATTTAQWGGANFQGNNAPTSVGGTMVTVGGQSAFVYYVSPGQVDVQVASNVATGSQPVVVSTAAGASAPFTTNVSATEPGLLAPPAFKINNTQYAVAEFVDGFYDLPPGTAGVAAKRAVPGDTIILYGIGFGPVSDGTLGGVIDQGQNNLTNSLNISIGGMASQVKYAGLTPSFVGLYQFNVVVPNIPASDTTPLTFTLNGTPGTQTLSLFIGN
ncbi:MAG: hypothetical protein ABSG13_26310 [Bryobacteraceae bacterium]|jgi:uncharacterized protein (TIGR03437 family)